MELPALLGIHHVALLVEDIKRSSKFYCGLLGYQIEWNPDPDNLYLTMNGRDNIALHKKGSALVKGVRMESNLDHFGIFLKRPVDVDSWHVFLQAKGVNIVKPLKTHRDGARSFYAQDPDGITIQFIYHPPFSDRAA